MTEMIKSESIRSEESLPELFGSMVFDEKAMKEALSGSAFKAWKRCVMEGTRLDEASAEEIAQAMKHWAVSRGATHFTHWFQPMTGATAEKHDSFLSPSGGGQGILGFTGKELVKGEPDASSFPSGGLRSTFEARGYTAWDPTSPAFVKEQSLYIPTIFCSYSGQVLDKKLPLLRSMEAVSRQSVRILRLFGDKDTKKVTAQVGPEQEYFLIDKELYRQRTDLMMTGRTLFGAEPPRGQEMEDHYFGMIKPRVAAFMQDLDRELWKVGVYSKTKHNEVAPGQHEMAPYYTDANTACDQNQVTMELMKKVADRHGFRCLIHEKPFCCVNGSGKHDNWSLSTDGGENLFRPGSTPEKNARFLLFLAAFVKGVDEYQDLLRATVATAGNDHRLGGQEAPPAIVSIFLGQELTAIVDSIISGSSYEGHGKQKLDIGVDMLPLIPQDNADRNRTSPMAFTGNKFEFRMLGSSQSISGPNVVLNTMMAEELSGFADRLEGAEDFMSALKDVIRDAFAAHRRILFDGNGYEEEWVEEAARRGLCNLRSTPEALRAYGAPKNRDLLIRHGIYRAEEVEARVNIHVENYVQVVRIEARTMADMVSKEILPAASAFSSALCERAALKEAAGIPADYEKELARETSGLCSTLTGSWKKLQADLARMPEDPDAAMDHCHDVLLAEDMKEVREAADALEVLTEKKYWPFPVYADLMFSE